MLDFDKVKKELLSINGVVGVESPVLRGNGLRIIYNHNVISKRAVKQSVEDALASLRQHSMQLRYVIHAIAQKKTPICYKNFCSKFREYDSSNFSRDNLATAKQIASDNGYHISDLHNIIDDAKAGGRL